MEKEWKLLTQPEEADAEELAKELNSTVLFAKLCLQRGISSKQDFKNLQEPSQDVFHSPFLFADMDKAVDRIHTAIVDNQSITVYGDYDADGVTSTSLLVEAISQVGGQVNYYIPNRFKEGYGPHPQAFKELIAGGTDLIISCDNGIQGHEAIELAQNAGVDVIVTDHHQLADTLPPAYAIIHPLHPKGQYPFHSLAGVGVAFKLAQALLDEFPVEFLDLVAVGTVADIVDMQDENYYLVKWGLKLLQDHQRPGLLALMNKSACSPQKLDESDIAYRLAPRLNAAGRMGDAPLAVDLLLAIDQQQAEERADQIENYNNKRKKVTDEIYQHAQEQIQDKAVIQVVYGEGWHEGVLGIVASRLVEEFSQPAIVLTLDSKKQILKGSGRSLGDFNLYQALASHADYFESFGGHHMAAGLTLKKENLSPLIEDLNHYIMTHYEVEDLQPSMVVDLEAHLSDLSMNLVEEINQLKPFGPGFESPRFLFKELRLADLKRIGADQTHLKCQLVEGEDQLTVLAFSMADRAKDWGDSSKLDLVGSLDINEWNGQKTLQCIADDFKARGLQVVDLRANHLPQFSQLNENQAFVFFNPDFYQLMAKKYQNEHFYYLHDQTDESLMLDEEVVYFVDIPSEKILFKKILQLNHFKKIKALFYSLENVYLEGLAEREDFKRVFKYIFSHKDIDYEEGRQELANYLGLSLNLLNHIIFVFIEVEYVKLEAGKLVKNNQLQQVDLTQTRSYQRRKNQLEMEELLLYSSAGELTDLLVAWSQGE